MFGIILLDDNICIVVIARLKAIIFVLVVILDLVVVIEVSTFIYEYTHVEQIHKMIVNPYFVNELITR